MDNQVTESMDKEKAINPVQKHTAGMLVIGAITWACYILSINLLDYFNLVSFEIASIIGIPFSWIINYLLNSILNFKQSFSGKRLITFCIVSSIGWTVYLGSILIMIHWLSLDTVLASLIAIAPKTFFNLVFQQAITFGWMGEHKHAHLEPVRPDYDWHAFYKGNPIQKWWKQKIFRIVQEWHFYYAPIRIADIGCGSSPILSLLHPKLDRERIGIEIDENKVLFMTEKDQSSDYQTGLAEATGLKSDYFDMTICLEVLEHHSEPHRLIKELARITKPNGHIVIATPDFATPAWNIIEVLYGLIMKSGYHGEHNTKFTESSVKALAYAYNLKHMETKSILSADKIMLFKKLDF